jgi:hypothetical protein
MRRKKDLELHESIVAAARNPVKRAAKVLPALYRKRTISY